jgi:hypothetical protein
LIPFSFDGLTKVYVSTVRDVVERRWHVPGARLVEGSSYQDGIH